MIRSTGATRTTTRDDYHCSCTRDDCSGTTTTTTARRAQATGGTTTSAVVVRRCVRIGSGRSTSYPAAASPVASVVAGVNSDRLTGGHRKVGNYVAHRTAIEIRAARSAVKSAASACSAPRGHSD